MSAFAPDLARIPAGEFLMGAADAREDERPIHRVYVSEFFIGRFPVTNDEYAKFVRATGHPAPRVRELPVIANGGRDAMFRELSAPYAWEDATPPAGRGGHPAVLIRYDDAVAYCDFLTSVLGRLVRLPTEAEWEKAARGGVDGRKYPWGNEIDASHGNFLPDPAVSLICSVPGVFATRSGMMKHPRAPSPYSIWLNGRFSWMRKRRSSMVSISLVAASNGCPNESREPQRRTDIAQSFDMSEARRVTRFAVWRPRPPHSFVRAKQVSLEVHSPRLRAASRESELRKRNAKLDGPTGAIDLCRGIPNGIPREIGKRQIVGRDAVALDAGSIDLELKCRAMIVIRVDRNDERIAIRLGVTAAEARHDVARVGVVQSRANVDRVRIVQHANFGALTGFGAVARLRLRELRD